MSIGTSIFLDDKMSKVIRGIVSSMQKLRESITEVDKLTESIDKNLVGAISQKVGESITEVDKLTESFKNSEKQSNNFCKKTDDNFNSLISGAKKVAIAIGGIWASAKTFQKAITLSDTFAQTTARLNLMNKGLDTTEQLQKKILDSANRSRVSFFDTADAVAKLGQRTGDLFASNDEIIKFSENLNKSFIIAGASQAEISSATLQLTQALGSGVLRGEELNAVFETAPNIIKTIADYMGVSIGEIRNLASEGKITANIIKGAILNATDTINNEFKSMPKTFSQVWTTFKNNATEAFIPIFNKLNEIANSGEFQKFINVISSGVSALVNVIVGVCDGIEYTYNILQTISPLIWGIVFAFGAYVSILTIYNTKQALTNSLQAISSIRASVISARLMLQTGATFSATVAQYGFNTALLACPLTWIILSIISVISVIYALINAINKAKGTTISLIGIIVGVISAFVSYTYNRLADLANFIGNVFNDPIGAVVRLFTGLADDILGILQTLAKGIDFIFGTKLAEGIKNFRSGIKEFTESHFGKGVEFAKKVDIAEASKKGYDFTKNSLDMLKDKFKKDNIISNSSNIIDFNKYKDAYKPSSIPNDFSSLKNIESNTDGINKSLNTMTDEVKFIKDISERKYINQYNKDVSQNFYLNYTSKGAENDSKKMLELIKAEIKNDIEKNPEGVYAS